MYKEKVRSSGALVCNSCFTLRLAQSQYWVFVIAKYAILKGSIIKTEYLSVPNTVVSESNTRIATFSLFAAVIFECRYSFKHAICFSKYCTVT